jgi:hypothetical protein
MISDVPRGTFARLRTFAVCGRAGERTEPMARDWSNERFVKLYRDEGPDEAVWCWQAIALWPQLIRKASTNGLILTRKGLRGVAALTRLPLDLVVDPGMAELLADGCVVEMKDGYRIPNYIDAQRAVASPNRRTAEWRDRERAKRAENGEPANTDVTPGDAVETCGDETKRDEAPCDSELNRSELNRTEEETHTARASGDRHAALIATVWRVTWEAETSLHAELNLPTLKPSLIAAPTDEILCSRQVRSWIEEAKASGAADWFAVESFVLDRLTHVIAVRVAVSRVFQHTKWWAPATFWDPAGIGKDLRRDPKTVGDEARKSRGGDGPGGPSRQPSATRGQVAAKPIQRPDGEQDL